MSDSALRELDGSLTLRSLLEPSSWQLPGWNEPLPLPGPEEQKKDTLDRLDQSLALLARYRNSLRPFNRLSPDILLLVFQELASGYNNPYDGSFGSYPWKYVAQVCHFWREVAILSPILWTQLSTRHRTAALACLERSSEAAVSLYISEQSEDEKITSLVNAVLPHAARLRRLYLPSSFIKTDDRNIKQLVQPLLTTAAPLLETLETTQTSSGVGWISLPTLFTGNTPRITRLRLYFMMPKTSSLSLSRLRTLFIQGHKHTPISVCISDFLDLLEGCPLLETLRVEKTTVKEDDHTEENNSRVVHLDNLKVLKLGRTKASTIQYILGRLVIPECAMKLKVWMDRYENSKFYMGIPSPVDLEPTHHLRDIRRMHVNYINGYEGLEILGATPTRPFIINGMLEPEAVSNLGDMDSIAGTVFKSVMAAFDLDSLEEFALTEFRNNSRWTGFTKKLWMDTFRRMPKLRSLHITLDGCYDEGFSRTILAALSTKDDRTGALLCPALESLHVWGDKTWSSLQCYMMAEERHKGGYPLKRVSMRLAHYASFSDPADTDLPMLRKYVETVDLEPTDITFPNFPES